MSSLNFVTRECDLEVVSVLPDGTKLYLIDEATLTRMVEEIITSKIDVSKLPIKLNSPSDANNLQEGQLGWLP